MGTKIEGNGFLREYHPMININAMRPVYQENWAGQNGNGIHPWPGSRVSSGLGFDVEKTRRTILEQELTFRNQLQELHHLYGRQKELMDEIKRRKSYKTEKPLLQSSFLGPKMAWNDRILSSCEPRLSKSSVCLEGPYDLGIHTDVPNGDDVRMHGIVMFSSADREATMSSLGAVQPFDFCRVGDTGITDQTIPNVQDRRNEKSKFGTDSCSGRLSAFPPPPVAGPNNGLNQRMQKLFGVELEGCNGDNPLVASTTLELKLGSSSWMDKSLAQNLSLSRMDSNGKAKTLKADEIKGKPSCPSETTGNWLTESDCVRRSKSSMPADVLRTDSEHSQKFRNGMENSQPWFLRNNQDRGNFSKGMTTTGPYFMNIDSLQRSSQNFFRKTETGNCGAFETEAVGQNKESLAEGAVNELKSANKIFGFPISDMIHTSENLNPNYSRKVAAEDDNKVLDDRKPDLRPDLNLSLGEEAQPAAPCRATTTVTTEIDLEAPAVTESEMTCEDYDDKTAAEALVTIASHGINSVHGSSCKPANTSCLEWFAGIVSSQRRVDEDKCIPNGIDHFEYMTLQLEESNEEWCHDHEPYVSNNNQTENEAGDMKRFRRGVLRRGKLRKDFQRDILPGMTSLTRLEVAEDFQAFEELMKPEGGVRQPSSSKNGRGRKRLSAMQQQKPVCQLQDRSLTGWGKRTKRLPRQRCTREVDWVIRQAILPLRLPSRKRL